MPNEVSTQPGILFVDDDADILQAAALLLPRRGFNLHCAGSPDEAWSMLAAEMPDVILLDLNFRRGATSGDEGLALLKALIDHDPTLVIVVVTGHSGINIAVAAMRAGAADFVMKPWNNERLVATLNDAVALRRSRIMPRSEAAPGLVDESVVIGHSPAMRQIQDVIRRAAATDAPILLFGGAGTGKTLLAQTVHRQSPRAAAACTIIDMPTARAAGEAAFESEISAADPRGTLVLEDIGALDMPTQLRLSAILAATPGRRLVATTRLSREAVRDGALHPGLLYRLNIIELALPRLHDRGDDVAVLAAHYLRLFARRYGKPLRLLTQDAIDALSAYEWPGNVRELRQYMERAVVLAQGTCPISAADVPLPARLGQSVPAPTPGDGDLNLARAEKSVVETALRRHGFNVSQAARELGVTRATLYRRMARHGL
jgi:DNA-binding NtrC family response regulator